MVSYRSSCISLRSGQMPVGTAFVPCGAFCVPHRNRTIRELSSLGYSSMPSFQSRPSTKAFFASTVGRFLESSPDDLLGALATRVSTQHSGDETQQIKAWRSQIAILRHAFLGIRGPSLGWGILVEYPMLRLGRRIDTVLLIKGWVISMEFKIRAQVFSKSDVEQTVDYALCLRDFHAGSNERPIVPLLCAEHAPNSTGTYELNFLEDVASCILSNAATLSAALTSIARCAMGDQILWSTFDSASYNPTPDIVTAARSLYAGHSVQDIGRADASGEAIARTSTRLAALVESARRERKKIVCFVTGEPGSGKTLLGLNLVLTGTSGRVAGEPAALLSGNRPLVHVLQEAIAEDAHTRIGIAKLAARRQAQQALQTLLGYLKDHQNLKSNPPEHVIVFDEAQRAWDAETGLKLLDREASEPQLCLEIMGRLSWACLVCLVGPGQEINRGEGGLPLWAQAIANAEGWSGHASEAALHDRAGLLGLGHACDLSELDLHLDPSLHLETNLRAYRNSLHGRWVEALLIGRIEDAAAIAALMQHAPAYMTRDLATLRAWLKKRRRGGHRVGLLASANATRLIAEGIPPSPRSNQLQEVVHWFLRPNGDYRSSNALEVPLSEFVCQGLEIDYAGLCWGNDLIWRDHQWLPRKMRAPRWSIVQNPENRQHRINTYRVLLTRARVGIAILVPTGDAEDTTRSPTDFEEVARVLREAGCADIGCSHPNM